MVQGTLKIGDTEADRRLDYTTPLKFVSEGEIQGGTDRLVFMKNAGGNMKVKEKRFNSYDQGDDTGGC